MSPADFVARLDKVRKHGDQFMACCPAHKDRIPSLSIREGNDGRILVYCFSGCSDEEIVSAMGLTLADLFQKSFTPKANGKPSRVYPSAVFDLVRHDSAIIWLIGCDMHKGKPISQQDYETGPGHS